MPVNFSIKNVPDDVADRLRERATRNHRSLQGELMSILERAAGEPEPLTPSDLLRLARQDGLSSADDSVQMIREDRDGR